MSINPNSAEKFLIYFAEAMGDSQTEPIFAARNGVMASRTWTSLISKRLNKAGCLTNPRINGRAGDTTAQCIGRGNLINRYGAPDLAFVYAGVNDVTTGSGTIVSSTLNTSVLPVSAPSLDNSFVGNVMTITGGTGAGQTNIFIGYTSARVATFKNNWSPVLDSTSTFTIAATTQAQMTENQKALIKISKYNVVDMSQPIANVNPGGLVSVWSQSSLPIGVQGQRMLVMQDSSTTGGLIANDTNLHTTIVGDYSASPQQAVWEFRASLAGEAGWGRVAISGTPAFIEGCSKIVVISTNYLNFTSGGDTPSTPYAPNVPIRAAALAAATAEGVVYCDIYAFQKALITGGTFLANTIIPETTQGSNTFHYVANDQHYSQYGHETVSRALYYTISAQVGWISDLSKINN